MQYNAILVSAEKVMAPIPIPKFNPGFGSRYQILVAHYYTAVNDQSCILAKTEQFKKKIWPLADYGSRLLKTWNNEVEVL